MVARHFQIIVNKHTILGDLEVLACSRHSHDRECREIASGEFSLRRVNPPYERMEEDTEATDCLLLNMLYAYNYSFLTLQYECEYNEK